MNLTEQQLRDMLEAHNAQQASVMDGGMSRAPAPASVPVRAPVANYAGDYLSTVAPGHAVVPPALGGKPVAPVAPPVTPPADLSGTPEVPPMTDPNAASADSGAGYGLQDMLLDAYRKAQQAKELANGGLENAAYAGQEGLVTEALGNDDLTQAKIDEAKEMAPIDDAAANAAMANEQRMKDIAAEGEQAAKAQMIRIKAASDAAANTEVKDFWADKTSGARIMGILAQALSGAANGLAGNPSAPTPLDRIIEQDIKAQMANMENKRMVASQEQSTMRLVYEQTGSRIAAQSAMTIAALQKTKAMSQALADKYATPKAQAENRIIQGQLEQKAADIESKTQKILTEQHSSQAMSILGQITDLEQTKTLAGTRGSGAKESEPLPPGVKLKPGAKIDKTVYTAIQRETTGVVSFMGGTDMLEHILNKPFSMENWDQFDKFASNMVSDIRKIQGTGVALSPSEEKNMNKMKADYLAGKTPSAVDIMAARATVARIQKAMTHVYVNRIRQTGAPVDLDFSDPTMGRHIQAYARDQADMQESRAKQVAK